MKTTIKRIVLTFIAVVLGLIAANPSITQAAVHTLEFVETPTVQLFQYESYNATSIIVTPVPEDLDGNPLTMASFGSNPTLTVDPGQTGLEEIESFTSIVNNGNNTATISGLTRDLASQYPYVTNGTGRGHAAGATVVFSNNPQMYNRFAAWENDGLVTGTWTFSNSTYPGFNSDPGATYYTTAPSGTWVDLAQLNRTAINGAPNASPTVEGILQVATPLQAASSTVLGSTSAYLALTSSIATSTCQIATSSVLTLQTNGHVYGPCLDQTYPYSWSGLQTFNATTTFTGVNGGILDNAASSTFTGTVNLNGNTLALRSVNYTPPASQGAAATYLQNNGSGTLSWVPNSNIQYATTSETTLTGTATSSVFSVPSSALTASSTVTAQGYFSCSTNGGCTMNFADNSGEVLASISMNPTNTGGTWVYPFFLTLTSNGLNSQYTLVSGYSYQSASYGNGASISAFKTAFNFANVTGFELAVTTSGGSISDYNIIVRP